MKSLIEQKEADKLNNLKGIYLSNPEVEFNYLCGNPFLIGNRTDISVTQSFDFPTVYSHRKKISKLENNNLELLFKSERINLLLSAKKICIELIYYNALLEEYKNRLKNTEQIAETYKLKLEKGETNIIESNKAQLNFILVQNEVEKIEIQKNILLSELKVLNGGNEISFELTEFTYNTLPNNFEDWYVEAEVKSPALQYVKSQLEINQQQVKLNKAQNLPKFHAGYMSESIPGEKFNGITFGISIPLWENKNSLKHSKALTKVNEALLTDNKIRFYNQLKSLYTKAIKLQQTLAKYNNVLVDHSNEDLLRKSLEAGEISLLDYYLEIEYYYSTITNILEVKRDLELSLAELSAFEL